MTLNFVGGNAIVTMIVEEVPDATFSDAMKITNPLGKSHYIRDFLSLMNHGFVYDHKL
jgi:hypothetical protein